MNTESKTQANIKNLFEQGQFSFLDSEEKAEYISKNTAYNLSGNEGNKRDNKSIDISKFHQGADNPKTVCLRYMHPFFGVEIDKKLTSHQQYENKTFYPIEYKAFALHNPKEKYFKAKFQ
jgi:hypothetical protein